jgi:ABC-type glutathione transport system ATPase component
MRLFRSRARTRAAKNPPHRFNGYAADMDRDHNEPSVPYGGPGWLTVIDVQKSYRGRMVVKGVSLETGRGEAVGLLGPNGAGKTTVFRSPSTAAT